MVQLGNSGLSVSRVCLGGNVFGWTADESESFALLDGFVAAGGNFIDTADSYSAWAAGNCGGESETIIGRWLARRGHADDLVIATKVGMWDRAPGLSAANVASAVDGSLRRLGVDRIDLFYAHIDDTEVPLEETLAALSEQVALGKLGHLGASNITAERLDEALEIAGRADRPAYSVVQTHYNLVHRREYEDQLAELVARRGLSCLAYSALADGFLTGKYRRGEMLPDTPRSEDAEPYLTEAHDRVLEVLGEVASRHTVSMAGAALGWLNAKPNVIALASARTPAQLSELVAALELQLTAEDVAALDSASAHLDDVPA